MKYSFSVLTALLLSVVTISAAQAATDHADLISLSTTGMTGAGSLDASKSLAANGWTLNYGSAGIYTSDESGQHKLPEVGDAAIPYIAVKANSSATYTLPSVATSFSFDWGTVDPGNDYNILTVTHADGTSYKITGSDILSLASTKGISLTPSSSSVFVTLADSLGIKSITLADNTGTNAFEASYFSTVPLPGALVLFGTGLGGLFFRRRVMGA